MVRHVDGAKGDLRGPANIERTSHPVGNPAGQEKLIVVELLLVDIAARAERAARGVRVGGRNHDILRRNTGRLLNQTPRLEADAAVQAEQVAHHKRELGLSVVEDEAARVQFVMHMFGRIRCEPTNPQAADGRRDVTGRCAGLQPRCGRCRGQGRAGDEAENQDEQLFHEKKGHVVLFVFGSSPEDRLGAGAG